MRHEWDDDPVSSARCAAFQRAAAARRQGYRWLNARGTCWIEPVSEAEFLERQAGADVQTLHCAHCRGFFIGEFSPRRRYCSADCSRAALLARQRTRQPRTEARACAHCGGHFAPSSARRRYCSAGCRRSATQVRRS